jgi:hypothetical protein
MLTDQILPIDLTIGELGTAVPLDPAVKQPGAYFNAIDVDESTGIVQAVRLLGLGYCFRGGSNVVLNVNLTTGATLAAPRSVACGTQFASAQDGGTGWMLTLRTVSVNFPGTTGLTSFDEKTLTTANPFPQREQSSLTFAVDGVNKVAALAYGTPKGKLVYGAPSHTTDSNAMSQIDLVDLTTGKVIKTCRRSTTCTPTTHAARSGPTRRASSSTRRPGPAGPTARTGRRSRRSRTDPLKRR